MTPPKQKTSDNLDTGIRCPKCMVSIKYGDLRNPARHVIDTLVFGLICETCSTMYVASFEQTKAGEDNAGWVTRVFV